MPMTFGPRQELAQAQGVCEFTLAHPMPLFDDSAARPHQPAAEAAQRDFEEFREQRGERNPHIGIPFRQRRDLGHSSPQLRGFGSDVVAG